MGFVFVKYIIACEKIVQHKDNTMTFEKVFEKKYLKSIEEDLNFELIIVIEHSLSRKEDRNIRLNILGPNGKSLEFNDFTLELDSSKKNSSMTTSTIINLMGLNIYKEGLHSIVAYHEDEVISKYDISFLKEEEKDERHINTN